MSTQQNRLLADYFYLAEASYADFSQSRKGATYNKEAARDAMIKKKDVGGAEQPESLADLVLDNPAQPTTRTPSQTPPRASAPVGVFRFHPSLQITPCSPRKTSSNSSPTSPSPPHWQDCSPCSSSPGR